MYTFEELETELQTVYTSEEYCFPGKRSRDEDSYKTWWNLFGVVPIVRCPRMQHPQLFYIGKNVTSQRIQDVELPCNSHKMTYEDYLFLAQLLQNGKPRVFLFLTVWDWHENVIHTIKIQMHDL